jgi:hypothetical protein
MNDRTFYITVVRCDALTASSTVMSDTFAGAMPTVQDMADRMMRDYQRSPVHAAPIAAYVHDTQSKALRVFDIRESDNALAEVVERDMSDVIL